MEINIMPASATRETKYAVATLNALSEFGHATNAEIIHHVHNDFPEVSATTIHRVTSRLKRRGIIACAPKSIDGSERYDVNPEPHHHFMCMTCGSLCDFADTETSQSLISQLKALNKECVIAGSITLSGVCSGCNKGGIHE